MFEIIAVVAVILAIAIAAVLVLAATKPDTLRVQRATSIKAPPDKIFPLINDFRQWRSWSPYDTSGRRKSSSSSISLSRSKATTPPSSQCCRREMAPISPGRCTVPRTSYPN